MSYGVTSTGFTPATMDEILTEIQTSELGEIDPILDVDPDQPIGQINGIMANELASLWEQLQTAFSAFDDTAVEDWLLDVLCALTGTTRIQQTYGRVTLNCTFTAPGIAIPTTGIVALDTDASNRWLAPGSANNNPTAGAYVSPAAGTFPVVFVAENPGPTPALAVHVTNIITTVSGWTAATNPLDATEGTNRESDSDLRVRRRAELRAQGSAATDAIYAALLLVPGVIAAAVEENTSSVVDAYGAPPRSFHAVIWDGVTPAASNTAIVMALWKTKPAGGTSFGATSASITDAQGKTRTLSFDRATQEPIAVAITVQTVAGVWNPSTGPAAVQAAVVAAGELAAQLGAEVVRLYLMASALAVPGVIDVPACTIGITTPTGTANIAIGAFAIATYDTSRVTVTPL